MKSSEFASKFKSKYLWGNILAMVAVMALVLTGVKYGLEIYTHHGEEIPVPNLKHKPFSQAKASLEGLGLQVVVTDTGYMKMLPPDYVLEQSPKPGDNVKAGHVVFITINSSKSPTITLPDIIDNSSLREAMAKLTAMGFKLGVPKEIAGEKDWVYGVLANGRNVTAGDRIPVDAKLVILVGSGTRDDNEDIDYVNPDLQDNTTVTNDKDEFEVVKDPSESQNTGSQTPQPTP